MADDTPFVWGAGGEQLTPGQLASRRKIADAMMAQGMDSSPIKSAWQGVDRVAKSLLGAWQGRQADEQEAAARQQAIAEIMPVLSGLGIGGAPTASASPSGAVPAGVPAAAPVASAAPVDTSGKIYANDEPSPLDPPSGDDRVRMAKTILGEAANEPTAGQNAVASVIRTRAVDGGYGGNTPSGVVLAKNQFEPWNTPDGQARMDRAYADPAQRAKAEAAIAAAYGEGGRAPDDPTEGMTHFYSPTTQAALGRPAPAWAGGESVKIGGHVFNSPDDAIPAAAVPTQGTGMPGGGAPASPAVATVAAAMPQAAAPPGAAQPQATRPGVAQIMKVMTNPFVPPQLAAMAAAQLSKSMQPQHSQVTDASGNIWDVGPNNERKVALKADKDTTPSSVLEYEYYKKNFRPTEQSPAPMGYDTWSTAKARASATQLSNIGNVDMNSGQTYDKQLAEGLGKAHATLANGVEDAQTRARDIAAMQGAIDAIQKNGGTTGGIAPEQRLQLQKSINAGAAALGIEKPFDETDLSDKEFLTKFNRSMAGAQAKNAVGSRVTNFEMSNYLKANPGLDMTPTGNQRLLGIQAQIEQRNIAVGNAIREATAAAISAGKKIDPVSVQKIITEYDANNHVKDPITGQDLTQSYVLPEFQKPEQGTNAALAAGHEKNVGKIRRYNPQTGQLE